MTPKEIALLLWGKSLKCIRLPGDLLRRYRSRPSEKAFLRYLARAEKRRNSYITYHQRPREASNIGVSSRYPTTEIHRKTAIVLQGPILWEDSFTLETVRLYKKLYRECSIVLSTWEEESSIGLELFRREGVEVVLSEKPSTSGYWNINYQSVSSFAGLKHALGLGAEYLLKTRTDQRLYATDIVAYLHGLLETFPLGVREAANQKSRLIVIGLGTCLYRAYAISDMFLFGAAADVLRYWSQPLDQRKHVKRSFSSMREEISFRAPEIYFLENYLKHHGRELTFTVEDSWDILARHFCVVDTQTVELCWRKYAPHLEHLYRDYDAERTSRMVGFKEWLLLYLGKYPYCGPGNVLDRRFGEELDNL